jgi:hypothetical protein
MRRATGRTSWGGGSAPATPPTGRAGAGWLSRTSLQRLRQSLSRCAACWPAGRFREVYSDDLAVFAENVEEPAGHRGLESLISELRRGAQVLILDDPEGYLERECRTQDQPSRTDLSGWTAEFSLCIVCSPRRHGEAQRGHGEVVPLEPALLKIIFKLHFCEHLALQLI